LVVVAFMAIALPLVDHCLGDDAFITFRYARNLLRGHGLVYNPGERVEGYTNFLWLMLHVPALAAGAAPDVAAQVFGLLFGAGTALLLLRLGAAEGSVAAGLLAAATVVALLPFAVECLIGLEMPLFAFLGVAAMAALGAETRPRSAAPTGVVLALATLTRPEGGLLLVLSFAADLVHGRRIPLRRWLVRASAYTLVFGPYLAWRLAYYGRPLPNTYYAKTGGGLAVVGMGLDYVGEALLRVAPLVVLALGVLVRRRGLPRHVVYAALVTVCYLAYVVSVGGDFRFHFRFFVPVLPFLALLAGAGADRLAGRLASGARSRFIAWAVAALCLAGAAWGMAGPALRWVSYRTVRTPQLFAAGEALRRIAPPDSLIAVSGGGVIPWVTDLPAIEMWGLTDRAIADRPPRLDVGATVGHLKGDGAYILSRRPRYVLFNRGLWTSRVPRPDEWPGLARSISELELWALPEFHRTYRPRVLPLPVGGYLCLFERRDAPDG